MLGTSVVIECITHLRNFTCDDILKANICYVNVYFNNKLNFHAFHSIMACGGWEGSVDSNQLEVRLRTGLEADRRYTAENAAKLRAIHSAPTYEEFRQLVLGEV